MHLYKLYFTFKPAHTSL